MKFHNIIVATAIVALSIPLGQAQAQDDQQEPAATESPSTTGNGETPSTDAATDPNADVTQPEVEVIQDPPTPEPEPTPEPVVDSDPQPAPQPQIQDDFDPPPGDDIVQGSDFDDGPVIDVQQPPSTEAQARASGDAIPVSPLGGAAISYDKIPSAAYTTSAQDISETGFAEPQQVLQRNVPGVIINDAAGSTFRTQVEFRGFSAGSLTGFPQGISVYQNGVRANEVFGDTVFFDTIPKAAISDMTFVTGNPVFGLNAVGGALSILMKDGFNYQGTEIEMQTGSFGRRQISVQHGLQVGNFGAYAAYEKIIDDGYRDFSDVEIDRFYGDIGFKNRVFEAHFSLTLAESIAGVIAASPVELLEIDRDLTFTSPQTTEVELVLPQLRAKVQATDTLSLSGMAYYRKFRSRVVDGNLLEAGECEEVADEEGIPLPAELDEALCSEELEDGGLRPLKTPTVKSSKKTMLVTSRSV